MNKILLPLIAFGALLFAGCAGSKAGVTVRSADLKTQSLSARIQTLPITADLEVGDQKVEGTAVGLAADSALLNREAIMKAIGQDPPSTEGADVLVGTEMDIEVFGDHMRITVAGYPGYYRNFRSVEPGDSMWLAIPPADMSGGDAGLPALSVGRAALPDDPDGHRALAGEGAHAAVKSWYVTPRWNVIGMFGYGWMQPGLELGFIMKDRMFWAVDIGGGFADNIDYDVARIDYKDKSAMMGGMTVNFGKEHDIDQGGLKFAYGGSIGIWAALKKSEARTAVYSDPSIKHTGIRYVKDDRLNLGFGGPFVRVRLHRAELLYRGLFGTEIREYSDRRVEYGYVSNQTEYVSTFTSHLMLGYSFRFAR